MTTNGTPSNPRGPEPAGVSAVLALVLSTTSFFALAVFGLGMLSLVTDADIIQVPGLGQAPGAVGMVAALLTFAGVVWTAVRVGQPLYRSVTVVALATALVHLLVVAVCAMIAAGEAVTALVVAGELVRGGASIVIVLAAAIAGWGAVALRRTRAGHPRWPWEDDEG